MSLLMWIEAIGCPTVCQHCWAQGVGYGMMPLGDIKWVVAETSQFCQDVGLVFNPYPMHEIAAHPQAPEVMQLFRDLYDGDPGFEPLATTGVPIATRDDWRELLTAIGAQGTRHFWVAFHGMDAEHDRLVHREGAFQETLLAVERAKSLGFGVGANVFVTRPLLTHFESLADTLQALGLSGMAWDVARYNPTARGRQYEADRPTLDDLCPITDRVQEMTVYGETQWSHLEDYTEAAWVRRAIDGDWEAAYHSFEVAQTSGIPDGPNLVCRTNFDLYTGGAGLYAQRHGNLKTDGIVAVLTKAMEYGPRSTDHLHGFAEPIPPIEELATRYGDPQGQRVYFEAASIRYRWLDQARGKK